jgi:hypothetical protein
MAKKNKKHDWNSWTDYLAIHERVLNQYVESDRYISGPKSYTVEKSTDQAYSLSLYQLILKADSGAPIEIKIEKDVEIDIEYARPKARTFAYSYHALIPKPNARNLIRYCSPHDHRPHHHKHVYDLSGGFLAFPVPEGSWPHVNEFIDEVLEAN